VPLTTLIQALIALSLSLIAWAVLRASYKSPRPNSDLSVVVDLIAGVVAVAVLVLGLEMVLRLAF
jgi:hypothetical protein